MRQVVWTIRVFQLRGWPLALFLLFIGGAGFARWAREHPLPRDAREAILLQLQADYARPVLAQFQSKQTDRAALERLATRLAQRQEIRLERITARGLLWPKYVRAEVSVAGQPPPDGRPVRYFTLGWMGYAKPEISALRYYCNLW